MNTYWHTFQTSKVDKHDIYIWRNWDAGKIHTLYYTASKRWVWDWYPSFLMSFDHFYTQDKILILSSIKELYLELSGKGLKGGASLPKA